MLGALVVNIEPMDTPLWFTTFLTLALRYGLLPAVPRPHWLALGTCLPLAMLGT